MSPQQISANSQSHDHPVEATLLPSPGRWARAVFRCLLFASVTVFAAIVLGITLIGEPLLRGALPISACLLLPLFILSFAFIRSDRRLAILGFIAFVLLLLVLVGIPTYAE